MRQKKAVQQSGFSLAELMIAMTLMLVMLSIVATLLSKSFGMRARESRRTDALTSAQAALNVMSREISNSGFGIYEDSTTQVSSNGLVIADSTSNKIHIRANVENYNNSSTNSSGENVTYFFDSSSDSIVRYDPNDSIPTSVVVNRISNVTFQYFDYIGSSSAPTGPASTPTSNTGRVRINVTVQLEHVDGQPDNQTVTMTSDVTLRNSNYMLNQY
jgi:prepilin-type N-terminal cleavage/methylation domain-containing protein